MSDDTQNLTNDDQTTPTPVGGDINDDVNQDSTISDNSTASDDTNLDAKIPDWENPTAWSPDTQENTEPSQTEPQAEDYTSDKNLEFENNMATTTLTEDTPIEAPEVTSDSAVVSDEVTQTEQIEPVLLKEDDVEVDSGKTDEPEVSSLEPESTPTPDPDTTKSEIETETVPEPQTAEHVEVDSALEEAVDARKEVDEVKKRAQEEIDAANENARVKAEEVLQIIDAAIEEATGVIDTKKTELDELVKERQATIDELHERVTKLKRKKTEMKHYLGITEK